VAVFDDGIAAELTGVLSSDRSTGDLVRMPDIHRQRSWRVHPPPVRPPEAEASIKLAFLVAEDRALPAEVPGNGTKPPRWAESDQDQADPAIVCELLHLDQVLLAGQSMAVAHQNQDVYAGQCRR
jgi:hypothetical protein